MKRFVPIYFVLFFMLHSTAASAALYKIEIQRIYPEGPAFSSVCDTGNPVCYLAIPTRDNPEGGYIDITMKPMPGVIRFQFMFERDYLYVSPTSGDFIDFLASKEPQTQKVKLYIPHYQDIESRNSLLQLPVLRTSNQMAAELVINITPVQ